MKDYSERRAAQATALLLQTLERNVEDIGIILDEFEAAHNDLELDESQHYRVLNGAFFAMAELRERINNQLNK